MFEAWAASHPDGATDHSFVKNGGSHRRCRREAQMCRTSHPVRVHATVGISGRRCSGRYGLRGVRVDEASHPGPSFLLRRATSVDVAPIVDSGRFSALAEDQSAVSPILLESLAEDLRGADADECSSVSSESCWGEMEDAGDEVVEWGVLPHPPCRLGGDSVARHEVNCMRENEAMGTVVDPTSVEFLGSQPVSPTTVVPDGPTLHQSIPVGVTECDEQSVVDEVDEETSDTASVDSRNGMSDVEGPVPSAAQVDPVVPAITAHLESFTASFEWLASVDMEFLFTQQACLMKSIPGFMKGAYRSAIRIALTEIDEGRTQNAILRTSRGWKLFLLIPKVTLAQAASGREDSQGTVAAPH